MRKWYIEGENMDWGYIQWAKNLLDIILDRDNLVIDYECKKILGENYKRLQVILDGSLDDVGKLDEIINTAENFKFTNTFLEWFEKW